MSTAENKRTGFNCFRHTTYERSNYGDIRDRKHVLSFDCSPSVNSHTLSVYIVYGLQYSMNQLAQQEVLLNDTVTGKSLVFTENWSFQLAQNKWRKKKKLQI